MDVVISERCSLKCVDCSNLMQFYESPQDISFNEILRDFDALLERVNHIYEIRLIGGELFMNK
jgi:molybdenum cofactor biosynthesis enzyme MoaA